MNKNVTFIDELFDVSSIQSPTYIDEGNRERDEYNSQIQSKHIRKYKDNSYGINGGMQNDFFHYLLLNNLCYLLNKCINLNKYFNLNNNIFYQKIYRV